jgi:AbrB family looped-hinge helix DNA binding protein
MQSVKVLKKGQITLPSRIRLKKNIHEGDTLLIEEQGEMIILSKGKTLLDLIGILPDKGLTIEEMREKAIKKAINEI